MHRDPYINRPLWARYLQRALFIAQYALTGTAGVMAVALVDEFPAREAGWALILSSALACFAVLTRLYNLEALALWPIISSLLVCVVWLVLNDAQLSSWLILAMVPNLGNRLLALTLIGLNARAQHAAARAVG